MDFRNLMSSCNGNSELVRMLTMGADEFSTSPRKLDSVQIIKI